MKGTNICSTNVVWVEQPVGTGFSKGKVTAMNENDVAAQFLGFFKNFVDTFAMEGYTIYITGESYAGQYVPFISGAMLDKNDTTYYNFSSMLINDPVLTYGVAQSSIPTPGFVDYWGPLLYLNSTFVDYLHTTADECGYTQFMETAMTFPPKGKLPTPPNADSSNDTCDLWDAAIEAIALINPCFDIYSVTTTCPLLWDVLGFPGSFDYEADFGIYFNMTSVQKAINAPIGNWDECSIEPVFVNNSDSSPPSALSVLPSVIDRADRVVIGHGLADMILLFNGTVIAVQNMTFNGAQGFSTAPSDWADFYVPYHNSYINQLGDIAGAGIMGSYHTERKLTVVTVDLSGHMIPQYAPSASYRTIEFLLGRIPSLGTKGTFTTMKNEKYVCDVAEDLIEGIMDCGAATGG